MAYVLNIVNIIQVEKISCNLTLKSKPRIVFWSMSNNKALLQEIGSDPSPSTTYYVSIEVN